VSLTVEATVPERGYDTALEVRTGETLALLGPNGAGKSTTLGLVAGLLRPHSGRVVVGDRVLAAATDGRTSTWVPPHRRHVGLLDQRALLFPHLSVVDNVAFGPRSLGVRRTEARSAALRWLEAVGLTEVAGRRATELSGGQAQRVAVARALAADPEVVLLDEPLAALDVDVAPALRQRLREVLADRTAVVATHDVLDALLLADRVAVVEGGRVVEQGTTAEVLSRPRSAFAARIAGLNLVRGTWEGGRLVTPAGTEWHGLVHGDVPSYPSGATAVFRPSAVAVHLQDVGGSPRNHVAVDVTALEPRGDLVRVSGTAGSLTLSADVTPQSVAELGLVPGLRVTLAVKATEVSVYAV
jgi:molybdate transport system ATP-binding protein